MKHTEDSGSPSAAAVFFEQAAAEILRLHGGNAADLRQLVVVLPNYHAAVPLAKHLQQLAGVPAMLLPQMVTFNDWAQSVPMQQAVVPDSQRASVLYQALRMRKWFAGADLWGIAHELLQLLDEMTRHHVQLPLDEAEFLAQLEAAYQAKSTAPMQFEARVVHELWYAMSSSGGLDAARANLQQLALLAEQVSAPIVVLLTADLSRMESQFLEACARKVPVSIMDMRQLMSGREDCRLLMQALAEIPAEGESLQEQALQLRLHFPQANLGGRVRLYAANGLEQEARAAELQVRRWLLEGKGSIAIVAQDRLVARRVRALLERAGILARDETGWIMSTLAVSSVLMRWLDVLQSDFYYQDLLDLLKSPYIFAGSEAPGRKQHLYQFERLVRKHGIVAGLGVYAGLVEAEAPQLTAMLAQLKTAADCMARRSDTLHGWLQALRESLSVLGILQGLDADMAGQQLLQLLAQWRSELQADEVRYSRQEWRHWLALQLDAQTWRDKTINSPVMITHLTATRWRKFDAVLLLGCDAAHLPGNDSQSAWFNDAVRHALGLPVRAAHRNQQRDDLLALLAMAGNVMLTWQASMNGEPNLASPYIELLQSLHQQAYADALLETELDSMLDAAVVRMQDIPLPSPRQMPAPVVKAALLPHSISASGYNSLVACPYQFFARHVLHLNELDEVGEEIEKRDFGEWVHAILQRFHQQYPRLLEYDAKTLADALLQISQAVFAPAQASLFWAHAWLARWRQSITAYIDLQMRMEADGWRYRSSEESFEQAIAGQLTLRGRVDRLDCRQDDAGHSRVIDYKLQDANVLANKLKAPGEDVQLPFYAHVFSAAEAEFISMEKHKVLPVRAEQDMQVLAQANMERLVMLFEQMRNGAPLPANGVDDSCRHCDMHVMCRRQEWLGR